MVNNAQNSITEATPCTLPEVAVKGAVAKTNTAGRVTLAPKSPSKMGQKVTKGKLTAKQRAERDNRFTSPPMVNAVEESIGKIDFDPCYHPASAVKPGAYLDIRKGQDGLTELWQGPVAFVNPPWSLAKKFLERAHDQWKAGRVDKIVCLVPAKTDTTFFHTVLKTEADVYFVEKRLRFFKEDGTSKTTAESVMIVMFGVTEMDKVRFAARVPGSWWLPNKDSSKGVGFTQAARRWSSPAGNPFSCSATPPLDGRHTMVLCAPIAGQM